MLQAQLWERQLLDKATQALDSDINAQPHAQHETGELDAAYLQCQAITREHSKTFYMASSLLPAAKRRATQALYAFCRVSDDIVDRPTAEPDRALDAWRQQVVFGAGTRGAHPAEQPVRLAWDDARRGFGIPRGYVEQLLDGMTADLKRVRYQNFSELASYCYGVACTVGLMSMHITGYQGRKAFPYAIRLGVALQLTNILRDVGEDWHAGRLYLPAEELAAFDLSEDDIAAGVERGEYGERWREFMRYQIRRARRLYDDSLPGVALLHPDGRFAIAAAGELYRGILDRIEASDYNVFSRRASLGAWGKLSRLPGIWLRSVTARV